MSSGKKLFLIIGLFVLFEGLYQWALYLERTYFPWFPVCIVVLFAIVGVLLITFMILNRGFERTVYTPEYFDASVPYEKRKELADKYNKNRERAKIVMIFFIPLAAVLLIDFIDLYFNVFESIGVLFS